MWSATFLQLTSYLGIGLENMSPRQYGVPAHESARLVNASSIGAQVTVI